MAGILMQAGVQAQSRVWPSAVRVGTDLSRIGISMISPVRKQYELNADVDLYKYFITCDFGNWTTNLAENGFDYSMSGWYLRTGIDYNFLFSDKDNQVMFFGLRYCTAGFNESFGYQKVDPYFGPYTDTFNKSGSRANWVEMNTGMKVHIWKGLYLGWTGRMKFGLKLNAPGRFVTYEVPGYGTTSKTADWGLNYSIYYRLVFRKKPPFPVKKIKPAGKN